MTKANRWTQVLQADCPECGAAPGQRCKRAGSWFAAGGHHTERYAALTTSQPITDAEESTLP